MIGIAMNKKGITLIELVIFILVGAVFLPFAYVTFTSAVKGSMKPETAAMTKVIAETKMNDINSALYDNMVSSASFPNYSNVTDDTRFQRTPPNPFDGYRWRWEVSTATYFTDASDLKLGLPTRTWQPNQVYAGGEYIKRGNLFYRVYFPKWQANTPYRVGNNIIPSAVNGHVYRLELNYLTWVHDTSYPPNSSVFPTTYNEFFYRAYLPVWQQNTPYGFAAKVASPNGTYAYQYSFCFFWLGPCISGSNGSVFNSGNDPVTDNTLRWGKIDMTSGTLEPTWPLMEGDTKSDGTITWQAYSMKSGTIEPVWQTGTGSITADKNLLWREDTSMRSGTTEPTWPTTVGGLVEDNALKWIESTVYKQIKVYVLPPGCSSGQSCEYALTSVAGERNYTSRP